MSAEGIVGAEIYPAAERNKPYILKCLQHYIALDTDTKTLLEVASGSGQHTAHFAPHFPNVTFQPTELDPKLLHSINAFRNHLRLANVKEPALLDVTQVASSWLNNSLQAQSLDYVLSINMVHISPYNTTEGLFTGASYVLKSGGYLFMYGPFSVDGTITPESNVDFDRSLRSRNSQWGLRDITQQLVPLALNLGLRLVNTHDLPANNKFLAWLKQ